MRGGNTSVKSRIKLTRSVTGLFWVLSGYLSPAPQVRARCFFQAFEMPFLSPALLVTSPLLVALGDFEQVVPKLGFYRALHDTDFATKDSLVKFWNHLSR